MGESVAEKLARLLPQSVLPADMQELAAFAQCPDTATLLVTCLLYTSPSPRD